MKNRTIIGLICLGLAVIMTFVVGPLVSKISTDSTETVRMAVDAPKGTLITEDMLETVSVRKDTLPKSVIKDAGNITGKYAAADLYAGDYLYSEKLGGKSVKADDILSELDGTKVAVSVTIKTFAAGLSGKLENGDIISFIVTDSKTGSSAIPGELTYVRVITATTSRGVDVDEIVPNDDGSHDVPGTVTVLVNTEQAKALASYQKSADISMVLVYRGESEKAKAFTDKQDEFFRSIASSAIAEVIE